MNIIKVNSDKLDICICKYCYKYIDSKKHRLIYKKIKISDKKSDKIYTINKSVRDKISVISNQDIKCYICDRYIKEIKNGPNIIKFIDKNKLNNNLILNIGKYKVWYFNDIYDNFGYYLRDKYSFTHDELTNIYKAIYELYALPNINIINEKATDIYNKFTNY